MPLYKNPDFRCLPPRLASVLAQADRPSFFSLPQWYNLIVQYGMPPGNEILVYTSERDGAKVALLLEGSEQQRCLTSLANVYSVEHGPICSPKADLGYAFSAIIGEIGSERPRQHSLRLAELDPDHPAYDALRRALRHAGMLVECTPGAATWFETTTGMTFSEYLADRPSRLRNTWQRKRRAVAAAGRLEASFVAGATNIEPAINDYQTIYAASWKPSEGYPRFVPELIRLAAELGALRLGIYYIDGKPAAAQFWIVWHGRAVIYKLAHDQRFDQLSLGTLLTMDMMQRVLEEDRPDEINFGRGDDAYKQLWLPRRRERWGITAANPRTLRGLRLGIERQAAKLYHRLRGQPVVPAPLN